jgi:hypothetical protein
MDKDEVISKLSSHYDEIKALGVKRLSIFGSVARGEARQGSDVDLAAEFDPAAHVGLFGFSRIESFLRELLGVEVDLLSEPVRKERVQSEIDRDRVIVF